MPKKIRFKAGLYVAPLFVFNLAPVLKICIPEIEHHLMRATLLSRLYLLIAAAIFISSCKKETEEFQTEALSDYVPLQTGKYITYRLDSTVFTNFGRITAIRKYQVKHLVDQQITDNEGRPSWRVFRFIRDSVNTTSWTPAQAWIPYGSYMVTVLHDQLEITDDDNLRFIKLHLGIREGNNWKGNKFLPTNPYGPAFNFSVDDAMFDWDYYYEETGGSFSFGGKNYSDVLTVEQQDETENFPNTDPTSYASQARSVEKYSKDIGLVYREYFLWEQQPNPILVNPGPPPVYNYDPFRIGFGIKMWMIDHN